MEDNHAIDQQSNGTVDYEKEYKKVVTEYDKLTNIANQLYGKVKQLENTWMLTRAGFLFEIIKSNAFNGDIKVRAEEELTNFLFPKKEEESNNKED